jgi:hypothetical protein
VKRTLIWALLLIAVCVLVFVSTGDRTTVKFFALALKMRTSVALLVFTGIGVVIGALLK